MQYLDVAHLVRRLQRLRPVRPVSRAELLADVAVVVGSRDGLHDRRVGELLRLVELVAAGVAGGVEVADVRDVLADRADDVASVAYVEYGNEKVNYFRYPLSAAPQRLQANLTERSNAQ